MTSTTGRAPGRAPVWTAVVYALVLLTTFYAFAINMITFATNDYRTIVLQAIGGGALASALAFWIWRRVPAAARFMLGVCLLANLWTLCDAGGRRLPEVMGW